MGPALGTKGLDTGKLWLRERERPWKGGHHLFLFLVFLLSSHSIQEQEKTGTNRLWTQCPRLIIQHFVFLSRNVPLVVLLVSFVCENFPVTRHVPTVFMCKILIHGSRWGLPSFPPKVIRSCTQDNEIKSFVVPKWHIYLLFPGVSRPLSIVVQWPEYWFGYTYTTKIGHTWLFGVS